MERYEALKLVWDALDKIISELEKIEAKIKPVFEKKKWSFDVGVDIVGSMAQGEISYGIIVYNYGLELETSEVVETVKGADSENNCIVGIQSGPTSYPSSSLVNLAFLKDWQKVRASQD